MSTEPIGQSFARAHVRAGQPVAIPVEREERRADECLEFVRFCYRRRRVAWPALYDEMAAVAARGTYGGLGFAELAERGVCFSLPALPRLAALTEQVIFEERISPEPRPSPDSSASAGLPEEPREEHVSTGLRMVAARG